MSSCHYGSQFCSCSSIHSSLPHKSFFCSKCISKQNGFHLDSLVSGICIEDYRIQWGNIHYLETFSNWETCCLLAFDSWLIALFFFLRHLTREDSIGMIFWVAKLKVKLSSIEITCMPPGFPNGMTNHRQKVSILVFLPWTC